MRIGRLALFPILAFLSAHAQDAPPPPQPPASATAAQPVIDHELDDLLAKATQATAAGDKLSALRFLESALQRVQKVSAPKERETDVLGRLGKAYLEVQRPADALRTYRILLEEMKADCGLAAMADRCADAQYGMASAQMYAGDFKSAVPILRRAVANYALVVKGGYAEDYRMNKLKQQADAQSLLAAALFRTGNKADGIAAFERAIQQFSEVLKNASTPANLRASAESSLKDAQTSLDLLKKN